MAGRIASRRLSGRTRLSGDDAWHLIDQVTINDPMRSDRRQIMSDLQYALDELSVRNKHMPGCPKHASNTAATLCLCAGIRLLRQRKEKPRKRNGCADTLLTVNLRVTFLLAAPSV